MKNFKKVSALALAMALTVASAVPAFAESSATYTGTINGDDLQINMDLPSSGDLSLKPYSKNQVATARGLAFHNKYATDDDERVGYVVTMAGYTCLATPKDTVDKNAAITIGAQPTDGAKTKVLTIRAEIGDPSTVSPLALTTAAVYDEIFDGSGNTAVKSSLSQAIMSISAATKATYDGKNSTDYTKVENVTPVAVKPDEYAPFRISGEMNEKANWSAGDKVVVVPIFSVEVSTAAID